MTRETKVGLVIAGSFLCLVGVVVAARLKRGEEPAPEPVAQSVSPRHEKEQENPKKGVVPATHKEEGLPLDGGKGAKTPLPPVAEVPNPLPFVPELKQEIKSGPLDDTPVVDLAKIEAEQNEKLKLLEKNVADSKQAQVAGKPGEDPKIGEAPPPLDPFPKEDPLGKKEVPPPPADPKAELPKTVDPLGKKKEEGLPPLLDPKKESEIPDPLPVIPDPKVSLPPVKDVKETKTPDPLSIPPIGSLPKNEGQAVPPIGSDPKMSSPPIKVGPGSLPQVKAFDVVTYSAQLDDKNFAAVSQRYYRSDKYADALLQYNRDHFLGKQELGVNPTQIRAGQKVFLPPADILEAKYPKLIGTMPQGQLDQPAPVGNVPPISVPPISVKSSPEPIIGRPTGVGVVPSPTKDPTKVYRVPPQGQHILEIARLTLGNSSRWNEIYRLNDNIRPEEMIPGGTEIRVPASANVP